MPTTAARLTWTFLLACLLSACQPGQPERKPPPTSSPPGPAPVQRVAFPATLAGFSDQVVFENLTNPIAVRFAATGKVFVAEENGRIYFYDNLSDTTPTLFADLRGDVNSYWDRGLLGFTIDPDFASNGFVYALYTHDQATNSENGQSVANRNGTDNCPSPPGGTSQGCVTYGRLVRITDPDPTPPGGSYPISARTVLVDGWPQQFPSHAVGALNFGPDGFLYATAGDGASFGAQDWGQFGIPVNPLGDPPGGVGGSMTSPTSRGGALRSQSFRRPAGENVVLNGTVIRINPATGAGATGNPNLSHPDTDARRIIAFGLRNPYRFTFHPSTGDIWIGDVGGSAFEEINRLPAPLTATPMKNFGWPCREGPNASSNWSGFNLCSGASFTSPHYSYAHDTPTFSGDGCTTVGSSAISGLAFYPPSGGNYPTAYRNSLFYADVTRRCIWYMTADASGLPQVSSRKNFVTNASNPVDLQIGPNNDLFYVDYGGSGGTGTNAGQGKIRRIRYLAPEAVASASPTSGFAPLTVQFTGSMSQPGQTGDTLSFAWDLDGDGQYDDSTASNPSRTYTAQATFNARLRVTDQRGGLGESAPIQIVVGSTTEPPAPVIDTPSASLTWKVGDTISFSGHASDPEDGTIPASGLLWDVIMQHCPATCHEHLVQSFDGVASGSFPAPDHEYPSYLQLRLTATDSHGVRTTVTRDLLPQTVHLTLAASPVLSPGLSIGFNLDGSFATPLSRTVILGSQNTLVAPDQTRGSTLYRFQSWSNGGPATQSIVANADATYTASFVGEPVVWTSEDIGAVGATGSWSHSDGVHHLEGAGADIWSTADAFRFVHQPLDGDGTITARITALENTNSFAKAGVMVRDGTGAAARNLFILVTPAAANGYRFQVRTAEGELTTREFTGTSAIPSWVRLERQGSTFRAYFSADGSNWTPVGAPVTLALPSTLRVGLAVTSHVAGTLASASFDNVTITTPAPPPPPPAPSGLTATGGNGQVALSWSAATGATSYTVKRAAATGGPYSNVQTGVTTTAFTDTGLSNGTPYFYVVSASNAGGESNNSNEAAATPEAPPPSAWTSQDVGAVGATGTFNESDGVYTIEGAGADIWGTADGFRFSYQQVTGDVRITARVTALEQTHDFSKAGVMVRASLDPASRNVHMLASPIASSLMRFIRRTADGATSVATTGAQSTLPHWVRVDRVGNSFSGYTSTDGINFTLVASETIVMNPTVYVGMAVTSHVAGTLATAVFDSVSITVPAPPPPPPAPAGLTATAGDGQVTLTWNPVGGATSYTLLRATTSGGPYATAASGIAGTSASDTGLTNGTTYYYVLTASNSGGESGNSNQASATPTAAPPGGDLYLEAEAGNRTSPMTALSDAAASGGQYIAVTSGTNATSAPPATGHATWSFTAPAAGNYRVWGRVISPTTGSDSFWVRIDSGSWVRWNEIPLGSAWHWAPVHDNLAGNAVVDFPLSAGPHTLEIAYREINTRLDRLFITSNPAAVPDDGGGGPTPPPAPTGLATSAGDGQVALTWSAASGADSYTVKRGTASGGPYTTLQPGITATAYTDGSAVNGTTYYYVVTAVNAQGESGNSNQAAATPAAPASWSTVDVGSVAATGSWNLSDGTHTVEGSGADVWGTADEFRYVHQTLTGNGSITARVASIENTNVWAKAGVMMRDGQAAGARNVMMLVSPTDTNGYRWQVRSATGGTTTSTKGGAGTRPVWLRITRSGNSFTGYHSSNGTSWTQLGTTQTIALPTTITVGLVVTSHADGTLATGVFDSVTVSGP